MSKAVLIIDNVPKTCDECDLLWYCHRYSDPCITNIKPEDCPLKIVPEKRNVEDIPKEKDTLYFYNEGFNECLKEIFQENNEK